MNVATAFFYLFAFVCLASALMVILSRNPVHSVLYLILAFVNASGIFMLAGAEFLALMLIVVYVGAVAVLFLFVVMMLDVNFAELREGFLQYLPIGLVVGIIVLIELLLVAVSWSISPDISTHATVPIDHSVPNTQVLGLVLYTRYTFFFESAGLVLLVAMIGAIVLTLRHKEGVKRQNPALQSARTKAQSVEIRKVKPGQGI